jgi:hypothetical protein
MNAKDKKVIVELFSSFNGAINAGSMERRRGLLNFIIWLYLYALSTPGGNCSVLDTPSIHFFVKVRSRIANARLV